MTPSRLRLSLFMFCSTFSKLAATSPTKSSRCCSKYVFSLDVPLVEAIVLVVVLSSRDWRWAIAGTICRRAEGESERGLVREEAAEVWVALAARPLDASTSLSSLRRHIHLTLYQSNMDIRPHTHTQPWNS